MGKTIVERATEQVIMTVVRDLARTGTKKFKEIVKTISEKKKAGAPVVGKEIEKYDDDEATGIPTGDNKGESK